MRFPWMLFTIAMAMLDMSCLRAELPIDARLLEEISQIKAIDNHAHPMRVGAAGEKPDDEYDVLSFDLIEPFSAPVRFRPDNPEYHAAWQLFYGYAPAEADGAPGRELHQARERVQRDRGEGFPAWVLDRLNIETMLANRIAMGRGLTAPRFLWVPFADPLIFPLNNEGARRSSLDYRAFFPNEERLLKRYLADRGLAALPNTLSDYLAKLVTPTLEQQKRDGAVAIKFEAGYLRKLDFDDATENEARVVYARHVGGTEPPPAEYKKLQDFLFRYIAREAGRLGLVVHIHCIDGAGGYYRLSGSEPLLLESVFNDPPLRKTSFVLVHGGYPFTRQTASLMQKPNAYADFSAQTFILYPRALSEILRGWLEWYPEKILFGTDAFIISPEVDWPELAWLSNATARQALALALTGMMHDGEITWARAIELARMVLRENALKLYRLPPK